MLTDWLELAEAIILQCILDQLDFIARVELVKEAFVQRGLGPGAHRDPRPPIRSKYQALSAGVDSVGDGTEACYIPLLESLTTPCLLATPILAIRIRFWLLIFAVNRAL